MELSPTIKIEAAIKVNDHEAQLLVAITSPGFTQWIAERFASDFSAAELRQGLWEINNQATKIVRARNAALNAVREAEKD